MPLVLSIVLGICVVCNAPAGVPRNVEAELWYPKGTDSVSPACWLGPAGARLGVMIQEVPSRGIIISTTQTQRPMLLAWPLAGGAHAPVHRPQPHPSIDAPHRRGRGVLGVPRVGAGGPSKAVPVSLISSGDRGQFVTRVVRIHPTGLPPRPPGAAGRRRPSTQAHPTLSNHPHAHRRGASEAVRAVGWCCCSWSPQQHQRHLRFEECTRRSRSGTPQAALKDGTSRPRDWAGIEGSAADSMQ